MRWAMLPTLTAPGPFKVSIRSTIHTVDASKEFNYKIYLLRYLDKITKSLLLSC